MAFKVVQVGTGGFGAAWCRTFLPPNIKDGHVEVVAAVDRNPDALVNARGGDPDAAPVGRPFPCRTHRRRKPPIEEFLGHQQQAAATSPSA